MGQLTAWQSIVAYCQLQTEQAEQEADDDVRG